MYNFFKKLLFNFENKKFYGKNEFDKKLLKYLNFKNGFFIECGAHDGITQSNTFNLEKKLNWHGILIEPSSKFRELKKNRSKKNYFFNLALTNDNQKNKKLKFSYYNLMTHRIDSPAIDNLFLDDAKKNGLQKNEKHYFFEANAKTLNQILSQLKKIKKIDFFSLDTEGTELEILEGLNFDHYKVNYILIESRSINQTVKFFNNKNYKLIDYLDGKDYLFCDNEEFLKKNYKIYEI
tara:strand:- start:2893 stop:3600 length:708 start_codon:yes stop_codon:yes gene_type:complete